MRLEIETPRVRPPSELRARAVTPPPRAVTQRPRRADPWFEGPMVLLAALLGGAALFALVRAQWNLWLPPDAAHALSEADYLLGRDVIGYSHPPAQPALVIAWDTVLGRYDAVLAAMCTTVVAFGVSLYALNRRWFAPLPAAVGALCATALPIVAEAVSWGGAASTLGNAAAVAALAMTDLWCSPTVRRRGRRYGWAVGALIGLAAAAHPFSFAVAVVLCGGRILAELARRRAVRIHGWGPDALLGWLSVVTATVPFLLVSETYYATVRRPGQTGVGWPNVGALADLVSWSTRESALLLVVTVAGLMVPVLAQDWSLRVSAGLLVVVVVAVPLLVRGDSSYQVRALYFLPALVALVVALGFEPAVVWLARMMSKSRRLVAPVVAVVTVSAVVVFGFNVRLSGAVPHYQRIDDSDRSVLEQLRDGRGTVAASYFGVEYAAPTSWIVNGVGRRRSWSPTGPWYSSTPSEVAPGRDMQRLFSGQVGVENGALQVSAWGTGSTYGMTISARVDEFYFPIAHLDAGRTDLPDVGRAARAEIFGDAVVLTFPGEPNAGVVTVTARLDDQGVTIEASAHDGAVHDWHLVLAPPAGLPWESLPRSARVVDLRHEVGGRMFDTRVGVARPVGVGSTLLRTYGNGLPVDVDGHDSRGISVRLDVRGTDPAGAVSSFDERELLRRYDISQVLVWFNSGTRERFGRPCYRVSDTSSALAVLDVAPSCRTRTDE